MKINIKHHKGFTLVEVLVAVAIFVSVITIAALAFMYGIRMQKENLAHQELLNQISYTMEYMSRAVRMAKTQTSPADFPCGALASGQSYEVDADSVKFLQYVYEVDGTMALACTEFYKDGSALKVDMEGIVGTPYFLTSPEMEVTEFDVNLVSGNPDKVQIDLKIKGREETEIEIQTTLSQRDFEAPSP